jgi:hypothetical protein
MKSTSRTLALLIVTTLSMNAGSPGRNPKLARSQSTDPQQASTNQNAPEQPMMSMSLIAPLFIADDNTSATLTLVHDLEMAVTVDVRVLDLAGNVLGEFPQTIPPHGQVAIDMNDRLQKNGNSTARLRISFGGSGQS